MSPKQGRPPIENPKKVRLEIRMTQAQADLLSECATRLNATKTEIINKGVEMVKAELDKK